MPQGFSIQRRLPDLNRQMRGWIGYFGLARQLDHIADLDGCHGFSGLRRPPSADYPRTKVRSLVRLGVNLDMAIKHAESRKTYWRLSKTYALRRTNGWSNKDALAQATLEQSCSTSRNGLMRTRLSRGVGSGTGNNRAYPI